MPHFVPTPYGEHVEAAIDTFGNRIRVAILGHLQKSGPCMRGELATALDMVPVTISKHLDLLVEAGLVTTDPPADQVRRGLRVHYVAVPERIEELYQVLGGALGIDA